MNFEFHYDYIKNKYGNNSRLSFTDADSLMYEIKIENVYKDFSNNKEMFHFSNYSTKYKYYDDSNKLMVGKMKYDTTGVAFKEFVGKPKMYLYLVDDNSEHEKAKGLNKNDVAAISHNEHKYVLLNKKCLRHSVNRIKSKDHTIGIYEINKISLSCSSIQYGGITTFFNLGIFLDLEVLGHFYLLGYWDILGSILSFIYVKLF